MKRFILFIFSTLVLLSGFSFFAQPAQALSSDSVGVGGNYLTRDEEDYNYLPILLAPGSSTGNTGKLRDQISYNLAYDQGYEAQCAKKAWKISPQAYGSIEEYFDRYSSSIALGGDATYEADFENATVPLFRGDEDYTETKKISSFEGFFGASDPEIDQKSVLDSGVITQLLSKQQQCTVKYGNIFSMFNPVGFCSKMENPDQCAVDYEIEGASLTTKQLYKKLSKYFDKTFEEEKFSCNQMARGWSPEYENFGIKKNDFEKTSLALNLMPLNTNRLYRLAFLVIAPQQNPEDGSIFGFLQQDGGSIPNEEKFAPMVISFKVPHLATNHIISLPFLRDAAAITSHGFKQKDELDLFFETTEKNREEYIENIIIGKQRNPIIDCAGMPQCENNNENALTLALVDLINGSRDDEGKLNNCSNFDDVYEQAGELGSPAKISEEKRFKNDKKIELLSKTENNFSWKILIGSKDVKKDLKEEETIIMAHLISPYGTDMKYLSDAMKSFFGTEEFEKIVENNCVTDYKGECGIIPEFLTLGGAIAELDSESDSHSFIYDNDPECQNLEDPDERAKCNQKSLGATVGENPKNPLIIAGGRLGFMIRKVQESLRQIGSKTYEYVKSCERVEDLFLGRCQGYLGNPGGNDSSEQPADSCDDFLGTTVEVPTMDELKNLVCDVAGGDRVSGQDIFDAQLLWGLIYVDGGPFLDQIAQGASEMSCGDLIINSCGASQIVGILVPHCIDTNACSQATAIAESEELRNEITPAVACSVRGSLEYILKTRKNETNYLKKEYRNAQIKEGKTQIKEPTEKQLYYMYAARNYGLGPEVFTKDACKGAPKVSGCGEKNYCECVMDVSKIECN